jgi:Fe2+ transport system protein FeoA
VDQLIPLALLCPGEFGQVCIVTGTPDRTRRLEEIGFRRGARVEMVQHGPPAIVRVDGCKFCFRESPEVQIFVRAGEST